LPVRDNDVFDTLANHILAILRHGQSSRPVHKVLAHCEYTNHTWNLPLLCPSTVLCFAKASQCGTQGDVCKFKCFTCLTTFALKYEKKFKAKMEAKTRLKITLSETDKYYAYSAFGYFNNGDMTYSKSHPPPFAANPL